MAILESDTSLNSLYYAVFDRIAPAANKYMATLFNTSPTNLIMVERILRFNWQIASVTGVFLEQYIARITAQTAGTSVTIHTGDSADTIPPGIAANSNSTGVSEDHILRRFFTTTDETDNGSAIQRALDVAIGGEQGHIIWSRSPLMKGLILRQNQGISIRNITANTAGSCSYIFEFTQVYQ